MNHKLLLLEINEFSPEYLKTLADQYDLANIKHILKWNCTKTIAYDEQEHNGLDPWVQWVSIHTGVPSSKHNIIRLGEVDQLESRQIWEELSERGITSGIWGAMNATKGNADKCCFFLPDPWVYMESAFPDEVNDVLALPRYFSKNYLDTDYKKLIGGGGRLIKFMFRQGVMLELLKQSVHILKGFLKLGFSSSFLFPTFDLINAVVFKSFKEKYTPDFTVLFLNSVAHFQHNYWFKGTNKHAEYMALTIDKILGMLLSEYESDETIWLANGLTQIQISDVKEEILYRQKNPNQFFLDMKLNFKTVEQNMTNDGYLLFESDEDRTAAILMLEGASINDQQMFQVEIIKGEGYRLFYQLLYWGKAREETKFVFAGNHYNFFDYFEKVVVRTGEHIQEGYFFSQERFTKAEIMNHEIFNRVEDHFSLKK